MRVATAAVWTEWMMRAATWKRDVKREKNER